MMAFVANQLHQFAVVDDAAAGNLVPVVPAPGSDVDVLHGGLESEERDWANVVQDAVREIGEKLLAIDVTEYMRLRSVCKPWRRRSSTNNRPTWEPCFFLRNWVVVQMDGDDDETPVDPAAPRRCRFVNVRTGATIWIQLPSFEEYGSFLADTEGLLIFYCKPTKTVRLFNPLTTATAVLPAFSGVPGLEGGLRVTAAGIVVETKNAEALEGNPIVVPNVVLMVSQLSRCRHSTVFVCTKL